MSVANTYVTSNGVVVAANIPGGNKLIPSGNVIPADIADYVDDELLDNCDNDNDIDGGKPGVSVQFSPTEFLSATTRLAHLDLEGFERFVGNTFDRAINSAKAGRTKSTDLLTENDVNEDSGEGGMEEVDVVDTCDVECGVQGDTDTYVWKDTCR